MPLDDIFVYHPVKLDGWDFWDFNNKEFPEYFDITLDMIDFYED